jgi:cell division protein FtsZ
MLVSTVILTTAFTAPTNPLLSQPLRRAYVATMDGMDQGRAFDNVGEATAEEAAYSVEQAPPAPQETPKGPAPGMSPCSIKVIGVGGGGGNTLNRMVAVAGGDRFIDFVAVNTDVQALAASQADVRVQIGDDGARGLGAGGIPAVGRAAAQAAEDDLYPLVAGTDMVFVTAGMGGGTGSGAAPVVADLAKQAGCLTVGIVTKPFSFEGRKRMTQAIEAIDNLQQSVDILVTVSNDKLLEIVPDGMPLQDAFSIADEILRQGIMGISEIIAKPGLINVDFADVRSVMQDAGPALMGIGTGSGKTRAHDAAVAAISSPLLDFPIQKAKGVVFTITGNSGMSLQEVNEVAAVISEIVADDANIIFGTSVDESYEDDISVTVVATSFATPEDEQAARAASRKQPVQAPQGAYAAPPPREYAPPDPYAPPAPDTRKPRFWGRF